MMPVSIKTNHMIAMIGSSRFSPAPPHPPRVVYSGVFAWSFEAA
jgi:hypothetical protein